MKIIVDADATPKKALAICRKAAKEFGVSLVTVIISTTASNPAIMLLPATRPRKRTCR